MKAIERLFEYFDYKGIKPTAFERKSGISNGYLALTLKRKGDMGSAIVSKIIDNCTDLSQEWLMLGKGEMLKTVEGPDIVGEPDMPEYIHKPQSELEYYKSQLELTRELLKEKSKYIDMFQPLIDQALKEMLERNKTK